MPFVFLGFVALLFVCTIAGYAILQPIANAVKNKRRPTRFSMVDFVWLTILAGGLLAPLSNLYGSFFDQRWAANLSGVTGVMILVVAILVWWRGIATLSGLGIDSHFRRGVFLLLVVPSAIAVSVGGFCGICVGFVVLLEANELIHWVWFVIAPFSLVVAVYVFRQICRWVLAGSRAPDGDES